MYHHHPTVSKKQNEINRLKKFILQIEAFDYLDRPSHRRMLRLKLHVVLFHSKEMLFETKVRYVE